MKGVVGLSLFLIGSFFMILFFLLHGRDTMQRPSKTWLMLSICLVCVLFGCLGFGLSIMSLVWLSMIFSFLVVFYIGGPTIMFGYLQGAESLSVYLILTLISALVALCGSGLLLGGI